MLDPEVYSRVQVRSLTLTTNVRSHVSVTLSTERNFTRMLVPAAAERLTSKRMPFSVPVRIQPSLSVMYSPAFDAGPVNSSVTLAFAFGFMLTGSTIL